MQFIWICEIGNNFCGEIVSVSALLLKLSVLNSIISSKALFSRKTRPNRASKQLLEAEASIARAFWRRRHGAIWIEPTGELGMSTNAGTPLGFHSAVCFMTFWKELVDLKRLNEGGFSTWWMMILSIQWNLDHQGVSKGSDQTWRFQVVWRSWDLIYDWSHLLAVQLDPSGRGTRTWFCWLSAFPRGPVDISAVPTSSMASDQTEWSEVDWVG